MLLYKRKLDSSVSSKLFSKGISLTIEKLKLNDAYRHSIQVFCYVALVNYRAFVFDVVPESFHFPTSIKNINEQAAHVGKRE